MSVTEIASALGEWSLTLKPNTPKAILNKLGYFGHIAISGAPVDPELAGDALLSEARYVGVLRDRTFSAETKTLKGAGMAFWLGDEDDKGEVLETPLTFTNASFQTVMSALLPDAVQEGTIHAVDGLYNGQHVFQSRRKAIDYVASLYDAEWRVNGDGTFDAGEIDQLYVTEPKAAILRNRSGLELEYKALRGQAELEADVKDFTTRVLLLAEGAEATTVSATANINPELNPYLTLFGDPIKLTRIVSEQQTTEGNAQARAQLQLNRFTSPREALTLTTDEYYVDGLVNAGDYVWVYDPDARLVNETNPVTFHGQEIHPLKLRVFQISWPIAKGMGVAFRTDAGEWVNLTDYVVWESGITNLTVGGYNRSLTGVGSGPIQDPGSRPIENSTIPGQVDWVLPFAQSTYQSPDDGLTRAQVVLEWEQPLNTDDSVIQDGYGYEIRYRTGEVAVYIPTHEELSQFEHDQLSGTFGQPIAYTQGAWQYAVVPWDENQFLLMDLTPGIPYDFQIRPVDTGTPPNVGEWSDNITIQTRPDTLAPSVPAGPAEIAGSRNAMQIIHTLGRASGGIFNLEGDLNHLEIHGHYTQDYLTVPVAVSEGGTLLGKLAANQGMMRGQIPAVGTFQLDERPGEVRWIKVVAVDHFGNRSDASVAVQQTAELIDSAFISELTVSKVSAGTIGATWIQAGTLTTAETGARVTIAYYGIEVFDMNNLKTLDIDSATGNITLTGTVQSGRVGQRVVMSGASNEIQFFPQVGETKYARIFSFIPTNRPDGICIELVASELETVDVFARVQIQEELALMATSPLSDRTKTYAMIQTRQDAASSTYRADPTSSDYDARFFLDVNGITGTVRDKVSFTGEQIYMIGGGDSQLRMEETGYVILGGNSNGYMQIGTNGAVQVVSQGVVKSFVIPHPTDDDRWLVHGCTESPWAGVEYWGDAEIVNGQVEVPLPEYFEELTEPDRRQVQVTVIHTDQTVELLAPPRRSPSGDTYWVEELPKMQSLPLAPLAANATLPKDGKFTIRCLGPDGTRVAWLVKAVRRDTSFQVEPLKSDYTRVGDGPYTYLVENE